MPTLSLSLIVVRSTDQVACDLAGETVILELGSGIYYGLNATASRIWELLESPGPASRIQNALLEAFDIEPERCQRDLLSLLEELAAAKLIDVRNEVA